MSEGCCKKILHRRWGHNFGFALLIPIDVQIEDFGFQSLVQDRIKESSVVSSRHGGLGEECQESLVKSPQHDAAISLEELLRTPRSAPPHLQIPIFHKPLGTRPESKLYLLEAESPFTHPDRSARSNPDLHGELFASSSRIRYYLLRDESSWRL
jgi:hypothetical protein